MTAPKTPSGDSPPGVAVIGTGYWGKNLVRVHHQLGALKLICDKDETVLARFREDGAKGLKIVEKEPSHEE